MKRVLVIVPTNDYVESGCWDSVLAQDYPHYTVMVSVIKEVPPRMQLEKSVRSTVNRNYAAKMALASSADYFLFVDSDIVLPAHAITSMEAQLRLAGMDIVGGWYEMLASPAWV